MCERAQGNLWGLYRDYFVGAQYSGEYLSNMWEMFMWAQNSLWAYVGIFVSGLMIL